MALTIRKVDSIRSELDWYKDRKSIGTDSKALVSAVVDYHQATATIDDLNTRLRQMTDRAEKAERILADLEDALIPALEQIQQQELDV